MDAETLYTINGGQLVALTQGPVIPRGLGTAIAYNLESFVEDPGLAIGSWDQTVHDDRPAAMSFTAAGTIVSVVIDSMDTDSVSLEDRIGSIHGWLAPMQLRDLSQLFTEPAAFYEGLWDMSPNATIALQEVRRYVVVTAEPDTASALAIQPELGNAIIDFVHLDVFTSDAGDDPIVRWSPDKGQPVTTPGSSTEVSESAQVNTVVSAPDDASAEEAPPIPEANADGDVEVDLGAAEVVDEPVVDVDAPIVEAADEPEPVDVSKPDEETKKPKGSAEIFMPDIVAGRTYPIESLPTTFDPNDELLESISDEMFAVPGQLVLVDKLPERRRQPSPFENPGRYRWDANVEQQSMLEENQSDGHGVRSLHLFVESDRQAGLATYVGLLLTAADNRAGRYSTSMWFDIEPKVSAPLWQLFRKGRLPELGDSAAVDLSSSQA